MKFGARVVGAAVAVALAMPQASWAEPEDDAPEAAPSATAPPASSKGPQLTLDGYLDQVRGKNDTYKATVERRVGSLERVAEAAVLYSPTLLASANFKWDEKLPLLPLFQYQRLETHMFSLGVQQQFSSGTVARLSYQADYIAYIGASALPGGGNVPLKFWDARPVIEISQPLWQNGFGRSTQAQYSLIEAQAQADSSVAEADRKGLELNAEVAYWNLAIARDLQRQQEAALVAAESLYSYVSRKASLNLGDKADALQAKASLETRKLDVKSARDQVQAASRAFNALRNVAAATDPEELLPVNYDAILQFVPPTKHGDRADTKAAEAQSKAATANAIAITERNKPQLDLTASAAMNGRDPRFPDSINSSYSANRPTYAAGVRLVMPLDLSATDDARRGAVRLEKAAELQFKQKQADQEQDWVDLTSRLVDARQRYELATTIEGIQKEKLHYERQRLRQGRTTTFQVLQFEQEFTFAGLARARAASEVLQLVARLKLYEGEAS